MTVTDQRIARIKQSTMPVRFGYFGPIRPTRFPELQYQRRPDHWRLIDASTGNGIGPLYGTEGELLADLDRFAHQFGCF